MRNETRDYSLFDFFGSNIVCIPLISLLWRVYWVK